MTSTEQTLLNRIAELEKQLAQANARNDYLEEQFRLAQQKQFGKSSEGFAGQGELFNEAEEIADNAQEEKQDINYTRNKPKRIYDNRLTRTSLTGKHMKTRVKNNIHCLYHSKITD